MGTLKALELVGGLSALRRVTSALAEARIRDVVVVTGYHAERLRPELRRLGLRAAHNPDPGRGMFSSVQTGVRALEARHDAFFVLAVDYALTRPTVLTALTACLQAEDVDVVHPRCGGLRGHPPLLSSLLRPVVLSAPGDTRLDALLEQHAPRQLDVDTDDLTVLLDMDTPRDLEASRRLAWFLEPPSDDSPTPLPVAPAEQDALYILERLQTPQRVVAHCRAVAEVGVNLAAALKPHLPGLDVDLVAAACLLHDMVRLEGARRHAPLAESILRNLGLTRLAEVVGAHMTLPHDPSLSPMPNEEELVYLADKLVVEDRLAGLDERERRAIALYGKDEATISRIGSRIGTARAIAAKVEVVTGTPLHEIIGLD